MRSRALRRYETRSTLLTRCTVPPALPAGRRFVRRGDLLAIAHSASGPWVTLAPNTWTELTVSGIKPTSTEVYAGVEPDFQKAVKGTVIYWDDMDLTS